MFILRNLYTGLNSLVRHKNSTSNVSFPVRQVTHQGGITSPFLCLVYIDGLFRQLETSGYGICIAGAGYSVADDMVLVSVSKYGLQKMMDICFNYSVKWRYMYNPSKCAVIVFNEPKHFIANRLWRLGDSVVNEVVDYTHLGVICNKFMKSSISIDDSCHKLKSTLLGLLNVGVHENGLRPFTSLKLYKSIVLPKALYGCELWSEINKTQSAQLERAHRFCVKYIQNLPVYTKTDVCLGLAGVSPIESDIDYRKLLFLGQICRAPSLHACKKLFNYRLFSFFISDNSLKLGFIPDIVRILLKYSLEDYLQRYMATGLFPIKVQ